MSMQQRPSATVDGWQGPVYPSGIMPLVEALDAHPTYNTQWLELRASSLPGFLGCTRRVTADGYMWFSMLEFRVRIGSRVMVAFPWAQDWDKQDGTQMDRSPAVYTRAASEEQVAQVLSDLTRVIRATSSS